MKKKYGWTLLVAFVMMTAAEAVSAKSWTKKSAQKWVAQNEWRNGFTKANLYQGTDMMEFASQYHKQKSRWDKAFAWLATHDVKTIAAGKYAIDGDHCFANVQDAVLRPADQQKIESHKKYIDLQWSVTAKERFGIVRPQDATVDKPYVVDNMFWKASKIKYVDSTPQMFFLFFPENYHQPCVLPSPNAEKNVRKVCIKIEYDE
jgi:biofilm protein TabA